MKTLQNNPVCQSLEGGETLYQLPSPGLTEQIKMILINMSNTIDLITQH